MANYYNEFDQNAAAWIRELIASGQIAPGEVDTRSIEDVCPEDLAGFTQCHFFAGIGGWSLALRMAGWPDDRPVWTGSCPCQPFSAAGKGAGFADERHLWPAFFHLISQRRPPVVFGEQVASADGLQWLDLVHADLEGAGYAVGAADLCAAGVGAPHIRQRLYWVADAGHESARRATRPSEAQGGRALGESSGRSDSMRLAHSSSARLEGRDEGTLGHERQAAERGCGAGGLEDPCGERRDGFGIRLQRGEPREACAETAGRGEARGPGPTNGHWRAADWLGCRDGKWRPVEPGTQQMVDGVSRGLGLLRTNLEAWEKVDDATKAIGLAEQVMRALREGHGAEEIWRSLGRRIGLPEATLLLAAVCQQQGELGRVFDSTSARSPQEREDALRAMQGVTSPASCSPQGRGRAKQLAWQLGDAVSELSQAHPSIERIVSALRQFSGSPLAHKVPGRVAMLRGYGNAIVPQVAAAFVRASY